MYNIASFWLSHRWVEKNSGKTIYIGHPRNWFLLFL